MLKIYPFKALIPASEDAAEVACPPYDVLSLEEAKRIAEASPKSFVKVIRPEVDPSIEDEHSDTAYKAASKNLREAMDAGHVREQESSIYLYRQSVDGHAQTGVVCCYDVEQYRNGTIKKHEKTRPDKENDRVQHMLACRAHPEPVLLTFPSSETINKIIESDCHTIPIFDFLADDGVQHTGWKADSSDAYIEAFANVEAGYIADGHHRTAAADRVAEQLNGSDESEHNEEVNRVLSVFFPIDQLRILAYNRIVKLPEELTAEQMLQQFEEFGDVIESDLSEPSQAGDVCFYCQGKWRTLKFPKELKASTDRISSLDVAILQEHILNPILGIDDPRTHPNIEFVGGSRGTTILEQKVDQANETCVAFSMFPTSIGELIDVSDEGKVMPPKSTWFDPKLRSGLFIHRFDS